MSSAIPQFYSSAILQTTKNNNNETSYWVLQFRNSAILQFRNSTIHKNTEHGLMVLYIEFCSSAILKSKEKQYLKRLHNEFCNSAVLQFYNFTNHKNTYHCLIKFKYSWFRNSAILHLYYIYICKYIYIYIFIPQFYMRNFKKTHFRDAVSKWPTNVFQ